jgi:selenocysteine-specific elongation factor
MIVGTAGHIDHGKTSLVKALTGVDADRLKEEKARGITIDLGFAYTELASGEVLGFVDVPGHEKLIHNMLAGATGINFVLLVIAADDGPMPQTREHLAIVDLLGLACGTVALTKTDRVSPERLAAASVEVAALLDGSALSGSPVFPLSTATGEGVGELRAHLEKQAGKLAPRAAEGYFRLAIDRAFTLDGSGTIVTGTVFAGQVQVGDRLLVSPSGIEVRVRGVHAQNRAVVSGHAGQRCALNLAGIEKAQVHRGDWLLEAPIHAPVQRFDAELRVLAAEAKPLRHWTPVHVHIGAADVMARVVLLEGETIAPGDSALVQIVADRPLCALHGDRFILRDQSATRTLGGGRVVDPFPPAKNRRTPARMAMLRAMGRASHPRALKDMLQDSASGVDLARFLQARNIRQEEARWSLPMRVVATAAATLAFAPVRWEQLRQTLLERLAQEHAQAPDSLGPDRARLQRMALPQLARAAFAALLEELLEEKSVEQSGPWLHLPGHKVSLSAVEEKLWLRIFPMLQDAPFAPPRVRDIAAELALAEGAVRDLLRRVARVGHVYLVAHDHYFTADAVARLSAIVTKLAGTQDGVRAAEFRDAIGGGRKLAIHILEFFDRTGYTRRTGEAHRLRQENLVF